MIETVKLSIPQMVSYFKALGPLLAQSAEVAMRLSGQKMLRDVAMNRMSNRRRGSTDKNLGVDTGHARRSMESWTGYDKGVLSTLLGSSVDYVKAHEEGVNYMAWVTAHERKAKRYGRKASIYSPDMAQVQKFTKGRLIGAGFRAEALRQGGRGWIYQVRAHNRHIRIVAKHFIRDTVVSAVPSVENGLLRAFVIAARTGKVPTPGQLGA
jgi:hypothetical protein